MRSPRPWAIAARLFPIPLDDASHCGKMGKDRREYIRMANDMLSDNLTLIIMILLLLQTIALTVLSVGVFLGLHISREILEAFREQNFLLQGIQAKVSEVARTPTSRREYVS
jgi:hypothetical protein